MLCGGSGGCCRQPHLESLDDAVDDSARVAGGLSSEPRPGLELSLDLVTAAAGSVDIVAGATVVPIGGVIVVVVVR